MPPPLRQGNSNSQRRDSSESDHGTQTQGQPSDAIDTEQEQQQKEALQTSLQEAYDEIKQWNHQHHIFARLIHRPQPPPPSAEEITAALLNIPQTLEARLAPTFQALALVDENINQFHSERQSFNQQIDIHQQKQQFLRNAQRLRRRFRETRVKLDTIEQIGTLAIADSDRVIDHMLDSVKWACINMYAATQLELVRLYREMVDQHVVAVGKEDIGKWLGNEKRMLAALEKAWCCEWVEGVFTLKLGLATVIDRIFPGVLAVRKPGRKKSDNSDEVIPTSRESSVSSFTTAIEDRK